MDSTFIYYTVSSSKKDVILAKKHQKYGFKFFHGLAAPSVRNGSRRTGRGTVPGLHRDSHHRPLYVMFMLY
jgi:hypothetical protein